MKRLADSNEEDMTITLRSTFTAIAEEEIRAIVFIDDERLVCAFAKPPLKIFNLAGETLHELTANVHSTWCLDVSPDKKRLVSGHESWGGVKVWNLETGALEHDLEESIMYVRTVRFAGGKVLVAKGQMSWVWSADGELEVEPKDDGGKSWPAAISPDGKHRAVLIKNAVTVSPFPGGDGGTRTFGKLPGDHTEKGEFAFSADSALLAAGDPKGNVRVWRMSDGELVRSIDGSDVGVVGLHFDGDKLVVLTAEFLDGGSLRVTSETSDESIALDDAEVMAVSPSGALAAIGTSDGKVSIVALR